MIMKKLIFYSLAIFITTWSCQDDVIEFSKESQNANQKIRVVDFKISNSNNERNFSHTGKMLSFPTFNDFEQTIVYLEEALDAHEEAFVTQYENYSNDELDSLETVVGFNSQQPLINFENDHNFQFSLRKEYNYLEEEWLNNEELNPNTDPDVIIPFDEILQTLLNDNMEVMIEGKVFSLGKRGKDYEISGDFENSLTAINDDTVLENDPNIKSYEYVVYGEPQCKSYKGQNFWHTYAYNKKVKKRIAIRSVPFLCKTKAKVISYKKRRNRWRKHRITLGVSLQTSLKDNNCSYTARQGWKNKSRKRRKSRTARMWDNGFGYALKAQNASSVYGHFYYAGNNASHVLSW